MFDFLKWSEKKADEKQKDFEKAQHETQVLFVNNREKHEKIKTLLADDKINSIIANLRRRQSDANG